MQSDVDDVTSVKEVPSACLRLQNDMKFLFVKLYLPASFQLFEMQSKGGLNARIATHETHTNRLTLLQVRKITG